MALQHWFHFALVAAWLGDALRKTLAFNKQGFKRALKVLKNHQIAVGADVSVNHFKTIFLIFLAFYGPFPSLMSEKSCQVSVVTAYINKLVQSEMILPDDVFIVR